MLGDSLAPSTRGRCWQWLAWQQACWSRSNTLKREIPDGSHRSQKSVLTPNHPDAAESVYKLAILKEHEGRSDEALTLLQEAVNYGPPSDDSLRMGTDPDFRLLHGDPRFERLAAEAKKNAGDAAKK